MSNSLITKPEPPQPATPTVKLIKPAQSPKLQRFKAKMVGAVGVANSS